MHRIQKKSCCVLGHKRVKKKGKHVRRAVENTNNLDGRKRISKKGFVTGDVERKETVAGVKSGELSTQEEEQIAGCGTNKGAVG